MQQAMWKITRFVSLILLLIVIIILFFPKIIKTTNDFFRFAAGIPSEQIAKNDVKFMDFETYLFIYPIPNKEILLNNKENYKANSLFIHVADNDLVYNGNRNVFFVGYVKFYTINKEQLKDIKDNPSKYISIYFYPKNNKDNEKQILFNGLIKTRKVNGIKTKIFRTNFETVYLGIGDLDKILFFTIGFPENKQPQGYYLIKFKHLKIKTSYSISTTHTTGSYGVIDNGDMETHEETINQLAGFYIE